MTTALDGTYLASRIGGLVYDSVEQVEGNEVFIKPARIAEVCVSLRDDGEFDLKMLRGLP